MFNDDSQSGVPYNTSCGGCHCLHITGEYDHEKFFKLFFSGTATFAELRRLIGCHTKNGELCKKDSRILAIVLH